MYRFATLLAAAPDPSPTPSGGPTTTPVVPEVPPFAEAWPAWAKWLIGVPLQVVIIVAVALVVLAVLKRVIHHLTVKVAGTGTGLAAERRAQRTRTIAAVLGSIAKGAVWFLAVAIILERLGVNVGVLVASIGVVGVGLGLGAQSLIKDTLAGLFMLIEDQYGVGDSINAGAASGVVEHVSLRVTTIRDADDVVWYIPNGSITALANQSKNRPPEPAA